LPNGTGLQILNSLTGLKRLEVLSFVKKTDSAPRLSGSVKIRGDPLNPFYAQVYAIVGQIPYGKVVSYGQISRMLGRPRAAREVGRAMRYCPAHLPWQRVVMADGSISGGPHTTMRRALLEAECVIFLPDNRVDMNACRWQG